MAGPAERAQPRKATARGDFAHELFFPGAFALALIAVPLWLLAHLGVLDRPAIAGSAWHAHEMLFGYTLAVVAGFLLARLPRPWLALLFGAWLAGRGAMLLGIEGPIAAVLALLFPLLLAAQTAPAFLRAARKGTNRAFAPILIGFVAAALLVQAGDLNLVADGRRHGLVLALDLVTLLLLLMGGRIIPAATAGVFYRRGDELKARVQPALERTVLAAAALMLVLDLVPGAGPAAGAAALVAGLATALRLARWRSLALAGHPDVWSLHLGYAWLALGLILKGAALLAGSPLLAGVQHAIAIGAIGTLTLVMMLRTTASRGQRTRAVPGAVGLVALALTLATLARLAAPLLAGQGYLLGLAAAAGLWATGILACGLLYLAVRAPRPG
jgi:uncharacterized protein involved in response to NO